MAFVPCPRHRGSKWSPFPFLAASIIGLCQQVLVFAASGGSFVAGGLFAKFVSLIFQVSLLSDMVPALDFFFTAAALSPLLRPSCSEIVRSKLKCRQERKKTEKNVGFEQNWLFVEVVQCAPKRSEFDGNILVAVRCCCVRLNVSMFVFFVMCV